MLKFNFETYDYLPDLSDIYLSLKLFWFWANNAVSILNFTKTSLPILSSPTITYYCYAWIFEEKSSIAELYCLLREVSGWDISLFLKILTGQSTDSYSGRKEGI